MATPPSLNLDCDETRQLWQAIQNVPDGIIDEVMADGIITDEEIELITQEVEKACQMDISASCHDLLRHVVTAASELSAHRAEKADEIESSLCHVTMHEIREVMGYLIDTGQIEIGDHHVKEAPDAARLQQYQDLEVVYRGR
tara:strand:- start:824 stop:1249 length:426 start_codon:yes stop_codon:yes gene_type:complete